MSFRQHNKDAEKLWIKKHRDELLAAGLPDSVVDDERSWGFMISHGHDAYQSGWRPAWITKAQAKHLLRLLRSSQSFWAETDGNEIYRELKRKIESDPN